MILKTAPTQAKGARASPAITVKDINIWETQSRPRYLRDFETTVYGERPKSVKLSYKSALKSDGLYFNETSEISVETLILTNESNKKIRNFDLVIVNPVAATPPKGIIVMQSFCPVEDVVPQAQFPTERSGTFSCDGNGILNSVFGYFFGRYIVSPPIEALIQRGYAFAVLYPAKFIPDDPELGIAALNSFFSNQEPKTRTRAIMAWAHQFSLVANYLEEDKGYKRTFLYGHSRYGKTSLVAGAIDPSIDGVIAHQSGTGGASLNREKDGETVEAITAQYPHWFLDTYTDQSKILDQHHLLALLAPRPVLLGNAKRDVWSDPMGAFKAAIGANPAYRLYGSQGLTTDNLKTFEPKDTIAFWMRPGTHGVVKEDWPAFLDFLDRHFD